MACSLEYINFLCSQLQDMGVVRSHRQFGDWCIYVDEKAVILACDEIAYVKKHPVIELLMKDAECGYPFEGAKEHYILDIEHRELVEKVVKALLPELTYPRHKKRKKNDNSRIHTDLS